LRRSMDKPFATVPERVELALRATLGGDRASGGTRKADRLPPAVEQNSLRRTFPMTTTVRGPTIAKFYGYAHLCGSQETSPFPCPNYLPTSRRSIRRKRCWPNPPPVQRGAKTLPPAKQTPKCRSSRAILVVCAAAREDCGGSADRRCHCPVSAISQCCQAMLRRADRVQTHAPPPDLLMRQRERLIHMWVLNRA